LLESDSVPSASTFVIRFWREWTAARGRWRGRIEHVQSGRRADFVELKEMVAFVRDLGMMVEGPISPSPADQGDKDIFEGRLDGFDGCTGDVLGR
jgi:hypothetical protein